MGLHLEEANLYAVSAIDLIVQLGYTDDLTTRVVASIREIVDADGSQLITNEVYRPDATGRAEPTGALPAARAKRLEAAGLAVTCGVWFAPVLAGEDVVEKARRTRSPTRSSLP